MIEITSSAENNCFDRTSLATFMTPKLTVQLFLLRQIKRCFFLIVKISILSDYKTLMNSTMFLRLSGIFAKRKKWYDWIVKDSFKVKHYRFK